jgi:cytochrome oxidase Cu insertion factor (SCO1/SenC/PrrC family)
VAATLDRRPGPGSAPATLRRSGVGLQALAIVGAVGLTLAALVGITVLVNPAGGPLPSPSAPTFLVDQIRPAATIELTGADGRPYSLAARRGVGTLVFFGYTHCPDVCPLTEGIVGQVIDRIGSGVGAVFVSVDPERDTVPWLAEYVRYLSKGFAAVTGSPAAVRSTADAWGVRYARVESDTPGAYSMTHTANVYLVDQQGLLRAIFPFGTQAEVMEQVVGEVLATPAPTAYPPTAPPLAPPTTVPTVTPAAMPSAIATAGASLGATGQPSVAPVAGSIRAELVSSSVWSGGASPVILALYDDGHRLDDLAADVRVQLTTPQGGAIGEPVIAPAVQPFGIADVSYVATLDIPTPGWWQLVVTVSHAGVTSTATAAVAVLDPGSTARLGQAAPTIRTPTLSDVGGNIKELTTDPAPDRRLYTTSTADALAAHQPFVLVIDSTKFRTTSACGKALVMARYLQDRWTAVPFIHLEPFEYSLVSDTPVLLGTLSDPTLVAAATAWGIGPEPWSATSMPWIFVVDGNGTVRAKYQGVMGSADIDVVLSLIASGR